jgi:hypothetical protein
VIGSNTVVEAKGKRVRGRLYPWGIVEGNPVTPSLFSYCVLGSYYVRVELGCGHEARARVVVVD